jgi:hypothetical protein
MRACELRDGVFEIGGLETTRRAVARFLDMPEMKALLPEHLQRSQKDAATVDAMMVCARKFFTDLMAAKGRRNDDDANAILAGAAALLPRDLFENKRGRSAIRTLGLSYCVAKKAVGIRGKMEDRGRGWRRVESAKHLDRVDDAPIQEWWHTDEVSFILSKTTPKDDDDDNDDDDDDDD